jgi:hypothetical protein
MACGKLKAGKKSVRRKKKASQLEPLKLMAHVEASAAEQGVDVEVHIVRVADSVSEGYGARTKSAERKLIALVKRTPVDSEDDRKIRAVLSDAGYGPQTRDLVMGQFITEMLEK